MIRPQGGAPRASANLPGSLARREVEVAPGEELQKGVDVHTPDV